MAAAAFAVNLLTRMPNCMRNTPEAAPDAIPAARVAARAGGVSAPALSAASVPAAASSRVETAIRAEEPARVGAFTIHFVQRACVTATARSVAVSVTMDTRYIRSSTASPSSPTMFRL